MAKKKQQKVGVQALVKKPKTGKGKTKKNSGGGGMATYAAAYRAALMDPFSVAAQGARVPDMYSAPTVAKHFSQSYTLSTGSVNSATWVFLPNLYMPLFAPYASGTVSGAIGPSQTPWVTMDGLTSGMCVVTPTASISSQLTNYRIVGYGVRLYATGSVTNTSGRVMVATNPVSSWVNFKAATIGGTSTTSTNAAAGGANTLTAYGLPVTSGFIDAALMPSMQNCVETSIVALTGNPLVITPKINSPEAFEFRQTADSSIGFSINNQTSASYVNSGDASYLRVSGHELVVVTVVGAPINTTMLQAEVVYHVEGTPSFSTLTSDTPSVVAAPTTMAEIVAAAARSDPFKMGIETAGNAVLPGLGTLVRTIL